MPENEVIEINLETGQETRRVMTPEEVAAQEQRIADAIAAQAAEASAREEVAAPEEENIA